jgi:hypothetical protein
MGILRRRRRWSGWGRAEGRRPEGGVRSAMKRPAHARATRRLTGCVGEGGVRACAPRRRYVRCCLGSRRAGPRPPGRAAEPSPVRNPVRGRGPGRSRCYTWTDNPDTQKTASLCAPVDEARRPAWRLRQRGRSQRWRQRARGCDDAAAAADPEDGGRETGRQTAEKQAACRLLSRPPGPAEPPRPLNLLVSLRRLGWAAASAPPCPGPRMHARRGD